MVDKIKKKRKELGMTQAELAEKCGVSINTIGNLETGKCCRHDLLLQVCEILGLGLAIIDTNPVEKKEPTKTNSTRVQIID